MKRETFKNIKDFFNTKDGSTQKAARLSLFSLLALGVVYGDIGTSPLYAVRYCFFGSNKIEANDTNVLGVLSLITWSLIIVISIKYLIFILRADDKGEGGILILMEMVQRPLKGLQKKAILLIGLFGSALLFGDGMITPAISVLSAVEGLNVATDFFQPYTVYIALAILTGLFLFQQCGSSGIGVFFGPIMMIWFFTIAITGVFSIVHSPQVLLAIIPYYGVTFFLQNGMQGISILGIVFLVVTGGEALYADLGHFGKTPIRIGWFCLVFPSLLLNYFGQGALLLNHQQNISNPFFQMTPPWTVYPLIVLATIATVIASQAIISGVYSLTYQAFQLGYLPRLRVHHTSAMQKGQIYVPLVNWLLLAAVVGLVIGFKNSNNLASAYGIAITATMVITTLLFYLVMRRIFKWSFPASAILAGLFLVVDITYFFANIQKIPDGGWFPLAVAAVIYVMMQTWQKGYARQKRKSRGSQKPIRQLLADIGGGGKYRRVPGQAVYLTGNSSGTPNALIHNLTHNHCLHRTVIIYTASLISKAHADQNHHLKIKKLRNDIFRVIAYYGFMERINVPQDLADAAARQDLKLDLDKITYFVSGQILRSEKHVIMSWWRTKLYIFMARGQQRLDRFFNLPPQQVFETGAVIEV